MISVSPARRRADEFAALVDGSSGDGDTRFGDLLQLVAELREAPSTTPRPEFVLALREQLMAAADEALVPTSHKLALPAQPRTRRDRRVAIAVGAFALVGASSTVAVASQNALPGDALYPIKRAIESAQTSLQTDDSARAEQILDNASGRLDEARALALRDSAESQAAIPDTLDDFVTQANQAADSLLGQYAATQDPDHITELRDFTRDSLDILAELKAVVPADLTDELDAAVAALLAIDSRAVDACPQCGGLLDIPGILLSGATISTLPTIEPRHTIEAQADGGQTPPAKGAVADLLDQLPLIGSQGGTTGTPGLPGSEDPSSPGDPTSEVPTDPTDPIGQVLEGVLGTDGQLLTGDNAVGGLLDPLLGGLVGENDLLP